MLFVDVVQLNAFSDNCLKIGQWMGTFHWGDGTVVL